MRFASKLHSALRFGQKARGDLQRFGRKFTGAVRSHADAITHHATSVGTSLVNSHNGHYSKAIGAALVQVGQHAQAAKHIATALDENRVADAGREFLKYV